MSNEELTKQREIIRGHFGLVRELEHVRIFSAFRAALNDARLVTGRNMVSGKMDESRTVTSIWLGTLCYMALLDQIGSSFKINGVTDEYSHPKIPDFKKALYRFSKPTLNEDQINALYALRCSYAHDYALINWDPSKQKYTYRFLVGVGKKRPMIKLPSEPWDGNFENRNPNTVTSINLELFGDHVERICNRLFALANADKLKILFDSAEELKHRYSYWAAK